MTPAAIAINSSGTTRGRRGERPRPIQIVVDRPAWRRAHPEWPGTPGARSPQTSDDASGDRVRDRDRGRNGRRPSSIAGGTSLRQWPDRIGSSGSAAARSASDGAASASAAPRSRQRMVGVLPRIDERAQRARALDSARDVVRGQAEMFRQQPIANLPDAGRARAVAAGLDGEVAFGVDAHRPSGEVRRANPHELVVDDHDFRVDERRHVLRARCGGIDEPQPPVRVGGDQLAGTRCRETRPSCSARASRGIPPARRRRPPGRPVRADARPARRRALSLVKYWLSM